MSRCVMLWVTILLFVVRMERFSSTRSRTRQSPVITLTPADSPSTAVGMFHTRPGICTMLSWVTLIRPQHIRDLFHIRVINCNYYVRLIRLSSPDTGLIHLEKTVTFTRLPTLDWKPEWVTQFIFLSFSETQIRSIHQQSLTRSPPPRMSKRCPTIRRLRLHHRHPPLHRYQGVERAAAEMFPSKFLQFSGNTILGNKLSRS